MLSVATLKEKLNLTQREINDLIEDHIPLIIKTVSDTTGKYVSMDNSEEFSVGLMAFTEALYRFEEGKGNFHSFAKLVISSRIKSFLKGGNKDNNDLSMEALLDEGYEIPENYKNPVEDKDLLVKEIGLLKADISLFGFTFEELVDESPKHEDTRNNAINLSEDVSKEKEFTSFMYEKRRLPIKKISVKFSVTEKIIKRSKKFIISVVIIFYKNLRNLKLWIRK